MDTYDVIVVGVGGMGSAAVYHLAWRGIRVLGIAQYDIPHDRGSSHGLSRSFKFARWHHLEQAVDDPAGMDRDCHPADEAILRTFVRRYFPAGDGPTLSMHTCLFTNTPDTHFVIDAHPECPAVFIAGGFSGHGFKFCSVVGEILADLAECGSTRHDISLFRAARFAKGSLA